MLNIVKLELRHCERKSSKSSNSLDFWGFLDVKPRDATTITCIHFFFIHGYQAVSRALGFTVPRELLSPEVMWRKKGYEVMTCYEHVTVV